MIYEALRAYELVSIRSGMSVLVLLDLQAWSMRLSFFFADSRTQNFQEGLVSIACTPTNEVRVARGFYSASPPGWSKGKSRPIAKSMHRCWSSLLVLCMSSHIGPSNAIVASVVGGAEKRQRLLNIGQQKSDQP